MKFSIFSSGSKQNCFYIETDDAACLIDMGISYRGLRRMLAAVGREIGDINGLFISHEHSDHTRGLHTLTKYAATPVYIQRDSYAHLRLGLRHPVELKAHEPVILGDLSIHPFPVRHDAANTFGFKITHRDRTLFLASDLGAFDQEILDICAGSHAIAIESNYDPVELRRCGYPAFLQARISGPAGHLSNDDAVAFLKQTICDETQSAFMLHLSINSNSREIVQQRIDQHLAEAFSHVKFHVSYRDQALPLTEI